MSRSFIDILPIYKGLKIDSDNYYVITEMFSEYPKEFIDKTKWDSITDKREYVIMVDKHINKGMMSDHPSETYTNQKFIDSAKGEVLIFGLGLGLIIFPILNDLSITRIKVVEIDSSWVDAVLPTIKKYDNRGILEVHIGDAMTYHQNMSSERFDTIYFDIWQDVDKKALSQIQYLHQEYAKFLKTGDSYMDSWLSEKLQGTDRIKAKIYA